MTHWKCYHLVYLSCLHCSKTLVENACMSLNKQSNDKKKKLNRVINNKFKSESKRKGLKEVNFLSF